MLKCIMIFHKFPESEDRQKEPGAEEVHSSEVSDNQMTKDASTPLENQIVGHNEAQDRYAQTVSITLSDQQEKQRTWILASCFRRCLMVRNCLLKEYKVQYLDSRGEEDMFIKKDGKMFVEHITVQEFKQNSEA